MCSKLISLDFCSSIFDMENHIIAQPYMLEPDNEEGGDRDVKLSDNDNDGDSRQE